MGPGKALDLPQLRPRINRFTSREFPQAFPSDGAKAVSDTNSTDFGATSNSQGPTYSTKARLSPYVPRYQLGLVFDASPLVRGRGLEGHFVRSKTSTKSALSSLRFPFLARLRKEVWRPQ